MKGTKPATQLDPAKHVGCVLCNGKIPKIISTKTEDYYW